MPTYFAAQAYDAVLALAESLRFCSDLKSSCVKDHLYDIRLAGASGPIDFDRNGDVSKEVTLKHVESLRYLEHASSVSASAPKR